jgi:hypothetical protein
VVTKPPHRWAAERILWYSKDFQDWNFNEGFEPNPVRHTTCFEHVLGSLVSTPNRPTMVCLAAHDHQGVAPGTCLCMNTNAHQIVTQEISTVLQEEVLAFGSDINADASLQPTVIKKWWVVRKPSLRTSFEVTHPLV